MNKNKLQFEELLQQERKRVKKEKSEDQLDTFSNASIDPNLFDLAFPKELESSVANAIFEIGLKNASPKVIISLMPPNSNLTTEHIKSHLQKFRSQKERSFVEFSGFFHKQIQEHFRIFDNYKYWEKLSQISSQSPNDDESISKSESSLTFLRKNCNSNEANKRLADLEQLELVSQQCNQMIEELKVLESESFEECAKLACEIRNFTNEF